MTVIYRQYLGSEAFYGARNNYINPKLAEDVIVRTFLELNNLGSLAAIIGHIWEADWCRYFGRLRLDDKILIFKEFMKKLYVMLNNTNFDFKRYSQTDECYEDAKVAVNRDKILLKLLNEMIFVLRRLIEGMDKRNTELVQLVQGTLPVRMRGITQWSGMDKHSAFSIDQLMRDEFEDFEHILATDE